MATVAEGFLACVPFRHNGHAVLAHSLWSVLSLSALHQYDPRLYGRLLRGACRNYGLTTYFTFRGRPSKRNAAGFAGSHVVNYLLEIGLLHLFLWMGVSKWLSPVLVMVVVVPVNFLLLRFVFVRNSQ